MAVFVFEDEFVEQLSPISLARPAYAISCASFRLIDWLHLLGDSVTPISRPYLRELEKRDYPPPPHSAAGKGVLLVNARAAPTVAAYRTLQRLQREGRPGVLLDQGQVAAALLPPEASAPQAGLTSADWPQFAVGQFEGLQLLEGELPLFHFPHDVVRYNLSALNESLEYRLEKGDYLEVADGVFAAAGAKLGEYVVTQTSDGPIILEADASIGPYSFLSGPVFFGRGARVLEHAAIKDAVSIGHTTKIGGEVEASVIEPYTNKQHHGFLGHSYLGSWINLGAGTCNSDLKNTYGEVNMTYDGEKTSTGMQFLGCIIGDYSKSAINTGIFTGKTIGVCSMLYGFVTTNVPSYVNYARLFGQVTELPPEVMVATQRRMFSRRNVTQRPCDIQLIQDMYDLTSESRQLAGDPFSL